MQCFQPCIESASDEGAPLARANVMRNLAAPHLGKEETRLGVDLCAPRQGEAAARGVSRRRA